MACKAAKLFPSGPARFEAEELQRLARELERPVSGGEGPPSCPPGSPGAVSPPELSRPAGRGGEPGAPEGGGDSPPAGADGPGRGGSVLWVLPTVAGALGWAAGEAWLTAKLASPSRPQRRALAIATCLLFFAAAGLALLLGSWAMGLVLRLGWQVFSLGFSFGKAAFVSSFWRPRWYATLPLSLAVALQRQSPLISVMWGYPVFWWLTGGGWWGSVVGTAATFLMAVLVGGGLLPALLVWTLMAWSWKFVGVWWLRYPLCAALLAGWFFLVAILGFDFSQSASEAVLNTDVPAGATGEVARVLGCSDYYSVLEIPRDADTGAVKKSHRRKVLKTHPDKLGPDVVGGSEAFGRVQKAFEILSEPRKRRTYDILLHDADAKNQPAGGEAAPADGDLAKAAGVRRRPAAKTKLS